VLPFLQHVLFRILPIGLRVGGVMSFAPFLGSASVPAQIKAALTVVITVLLYPVCPVPPIAPTLSGWTHLVLGEITLGLAIGLCLQFVFEGAQLAGQLAGFQFAFSLVNVIDPQTNVDTPVFSIFYQLVALLLFLQFNIHHWVLRSIVKSFEYAPVGSIVMSAGAMKELFRAAGGMWLVGVQIAMPVLLATMLLDITVGFLSKASPQMPAIYLSIPIKSLVGYAVLATSVGLWPGIFEKQFALALGWTERLFHLAH
jgi:flagellar biosynthetic protein FliR